MNNRNLHSPTKLTEFARDFDTEPDTFLAKVVNKITNVYNSGYNSVNVVPSSSSSVLNVGASGESSLAGFAATPTKSSSESSVSSLSTISEAPSTSKAQKNDQSDDLSDPNSNNSRAQPSVKQRFGNLMAIRNSNNLTRYKDTELHQFWMPDDKSKECYECSQKFSTFRRKHHCRLCGQIFCSKCCNQVVPGKIIKCSGDLKVCTYCSKFVLTYLKSSDINSDLKSDLKALQEDLSNKFTVNSDESSSAAQELSSPHRKVSVGYQEERLLSQPKNLLSNADRKTILQQSTSLKILYEELCKELPMQNLGADIVQYLITKNKSSNKMQAIAILTAMLEAGYMNVIDAVQLGPLKSASSVNLNDETNDSGSTDQETVHEFSEHFHYRFVRLRELMTNSGTFQLDLDVDESSVHVRRPDSTDSSADSMMPSKDGNFTIKPIRESDEENAMMSTTGAKNLLEAFCRHEEALLNQLLRNESLDESWSKILVQICARIVNNFPPEIIGSDSMDIRNYVNFKKVPDGQRAESRIVGGVVFSKNVVHKDMATTIENARILLLQCPIVYQRNEGKFVSIETLMLQEREYLTSVVGRIRSLNPNVILVHKNVSGVAQDMLRACNITLVVDVKLSVLKRLSRCLECDIVSSIESNIGKPKLGACAKFYVRQFQNSLGCSKALIFVEMSPSPRGCSVLLRGGTIQELIRLKRVASFLLFTRYNWRLEMSFLLAQFAVPPQPKADLFIGKESPEKELKPEHLTHSAKNASKRFVEKKFDDKPVAKEDVEDFSDPLRAPEAPTKSENVKLEVEMPYDNHFRTALSSTILSISPFSQFPLPYLETETGRKCTLRKQFPNELYYSKQWSGNLEKCVNFERTPSKVDDATTRPAHAFLQTKFVVPAESREFQSILANFRASGGLLKKKAKMTPIDRRSEEKIDEQKSEHPMIIRDALDINNHQRLPLLFCSFYRSPKASASFCKPPSQLNMYFYGANDIMLGEFLERYCFNCSYICESCNLPMLDHVRRYVHSMGCVTVMLSEDFQDTNLSQIVMTSWCQKCKVMTPSVAMQKDTSCLSFGKYLEMRFHGHAYRRRPLHEFERTDSSIEAIVECSHSLHRDYVQYFSFNGIAASFSYSPIDVWELSFPSLILSLDRMQCGDKNELMNDVKNLSNKGHNVYVEIYHQLADMTNEINFPNLDVLKEAVNADQELYRKSIAVLYTLLTEYTIDLNKICDAIVMAKRLHAEHVEQWNQRLGETANQCRDIVANGNSKQETTNTSINQSQSSTPIDAGTICTEDLRSDVESPTTLEPNEPKTSTVEREAKAPVSDKKSVKTRLRVLLDKNIQINIPSPILANEHHTLPLCTIPIGVHDQDISSVIAYALMARDYKRMLDKLNFCVEAPRKSSDSVSDADEKENEQKDKKKDSKTSTAHVEINFQDASTHFMCKIFFARDFDLMRNRLLRPMDGTAVEEEIQFDGNDDDALAIENKRIAFARSLSKSIQWDARGGKSGSKFCKTFDDRFVLKEMTKNDLTIFESFAPNYFEYINQCVQTNHPTLLAKIFGVFKVVIKKENVQEKSVLVMENLFYKCDIANKFDLKGSVRNRLAAETNQNGGEIVLLDENLIQMSWSKPLYILSHSKAILREAIYRDASFLEKNCVMDYSLLVGLNSDGKLLVLGIIDYIRTYTIDKRLESFVKQSLTKPGILPTIVSPKLYRQRFSEAMERYFLAVPDRWEGLQNELYMKN